MSVINAVTCPICGCLCDDIEVTVVNNEVVKLNIWDIKASTESSSL